MGEAPTFAGGRCDRRDVVVAVDPGDLLRVVRGVDEVRPPGGRGDEHVGVIGARTSLVDGAAEVAKDPQHPLAWVLDTDDAARLRDVEEVCRALGGVVDVRHAGVGRAAAVLDEEVDGQLRGSGGHPGVDAALEALRGLGDESVAAGRASDGRRVEVGGFDEHLGRRVVHLGGRATHHAGDGERPFTRVGDQQVLGTQRAFDIVERRQGFARPGATHHDGAVELGEVVGVQRLPDGEHDVVRHVDCQADRAHPHLGEAPLHPRR